MFAWIVTNTYWQDQLWVRQGTARPFRVILDVIKCDISTATGNEVKTRPSGGTDNGKDKIPIYK